MAPLHGILRAMKRVNALWLCAVLAACGKDAAGPVPVAFVAVAPDTATLRLGAVACFTATVRGGSDAVLWRAGSGTVTPDGCYTARHVGRDTLTVMSAVDTTRWARARIWVRDTAPPVVVRTSPAQGDSLAPVLPLIQVTFAGPVDSSGTLTMTQGATTLVAVPVGHPWTGTLLFRAALPLDYAVPVTATLTDVRDTSGNPMRPYTWTFRPGAFTWPFGQLLPTPIPTYDGSGSSVHPSVLHFATGWHGWQYVMAYTPYPLLRAAYENPSLAVSHDGLVWVTPPGLHNPVLLPGPGRGEAQAIRATPARRPAPGCSPTPT